MTSVLQKLQTYLKEIEKNDKKGKKINAFLELNPNALEEAKAIDAKIQRLSQVRSASSKLGQIKGKLAGKIIAVKSNINVLGLTASCASKTLENYKATYDADVIKKIKEEDGLIIGMTNMDEFASGSSGETSAFGPTKNPKNVELIPGGSSSGSAAAVAAGFCDAALGSDTGGSIRNPASHCGVVGVKPSYGSVSRYGLIDLSMSLEQIGVFSREVYGSALLLDVIKGKSDYDATTIESKDSHSKKINDAKKLTIGVSSDLIKLCKDKDIIKIFDNKIKI